MNHQDTKAPSPEKISLRTELTLREMKQTLDRARGTEAFRPQHQLMLDALNEVLENLCASVPPVKSEREEEGRVPALQEDQL